MARRRRLRDVSRTSSISDRTKLVCHYKSSQPLGSSHRLSLYLKLCIFYLSDVLVRFILQACLKISTRTGTTIASLEAIAGGRWKTLPPT